MVDAERRPAEEAPYRVVRLRLGQSVQVGRVLLRLDLIEGNRVELRASELIEPACVTPVSPLTAPAAP